jgi:fatty acid desaturase
MRLRVAPRVDSVQWRDLVALSRYEIARELLISVPWLALSLFAAHATMYPAALAASFMFFLTGLRQVHNAYHYALGISRGATEVLMFALSILMLGSMHAVRINHLRHHRDCLGPDDVEAMSVRLPAWRAILIGPWFPLRLHATALAVATRRQRRWIVAELAANAFWIALVFAVLRNPVLEYHVIAMACGQCLTAFFAVWTVHHDVADAPFPARTIRHPFKARISYAMFYHVEHHLFPAVPTCHLRRLATRIDRVAPELATLNVF